MGCGSWVVDMERHLRYNGPSIKALCGWLVLSCGLLVLDYGLLVLSCGGRFWLLGTDFGRGWVLFLIIGFGFVCGYACGWDLILWVGEPIWVLGFRGGCAVSEFWVDGCL